MPKARVTIRHSAEMAALHQHSNVSVKELQTMFPNYSRCTIYRHAKKKIGEPEKSNNSKFNTGRPSKLSARDKRKIVLAFKTLRDKEVSFTSSRVAVRAGVADRVSNRTVRRVLNDEGYEYLSTRKKGVMKNKDFAERSKFCRKVRNRKLGVQFWTEHISFYLDATGFQYKTNPFDQARAPKAREWRKKSEGLIVTSKGKKEGQVNSNFMVGISYNHGVVLCEKYDGAITGQKVANIVKSSFAEAFKNSVSPRGKRVLMDGCPRQNSKIAHDSYDSVGAKIMKIPPRSPDLNPIENFFHLVKRELRKQALEEQITSETIEEFNNRVEKTLKQFPICTINNIIASMDKRVGMILKAKGRRIRY